MLDRVERNHRLHHRHVNDLAATSALSVEQGDGDRIGCMDGGDLVGDDRRDVAGFACNSRLERCQSRCGLNDIVVGWLTTVCAFIGKAFDMAKNDPGIEFDEFVV